MKSNIRLSDKALFVGMGHTGQILSLCWSKKFNNAAVYDFNKQKLKNFQNGTITQEELNLKKLYNRTIHKIKFEKKKNIKKYKNIFFTEDTELSLNGKPNSKNLEKNLIKISKIVASGANVYLSSQVRPGFTRKFYKKYFEPKKINLIYFLESLVMGSAIERFLSPKMLVFGVSDNYKKITYKHFTKFKCPIFFKKFEEAEMVKLSINIFLSCSVSFANSLDLYCQQNGFFFKSIVEILKLDSRIGPYSYINPSLGLSGGHLERDLNYIISNSKDFLVKNKFLNILKIEKNRIFQLLNEVKKLPRKFNKNKIIWLGISYKKDSFSLVNSWYLRFKRELNRKVYFYDFYKVSKKLENFFFSIYSNTFDNKIFIFNYLNEKDEKFFNTKISQAKNSVVISVSNNSLRCKHKKIF